MKKLVFPAMLMVLVGHVAVAAPSKSSATKRFLVPSEIVEIVEKSDTYYEISLSMEGLENVNPTNTTESLFPLSVRPMEHPWRTPTEDGSYKLAEYAFNEELTTMFNEAESLFVDGRFPEAMRSYQKIIDRFPDCYIAYSHLGDCHYRTRQYKRAIEFLDRAIELNPFDHRAFLYKADALANLNQLKEAKAAYIHSLSLRPRYWLAMANVQHLSGKLGVEVRTDLFQPKVFVQRKGNRIGVYFSDESSVKLWLAYALVKAVWLGEPSHRQYHIGSAAPGWSMTEETEALLNLVTVYESLKQTEKIKPDPRLDLLLKIVDTGDLSCFIAYEIASRINPNFTLTVSEDIRQSLREFIAKYVVVPASQDENVTGANPMVAANVERKQ